MRGQKLASSLAFHIRMPDDDIIINPHVSLLGFLSAVIQGVSDVPVEWLSYLWLSSRPLLKDIELLQQLPAGTTMPVGGSGTLMTLYTGWGQAESPFTTKCLSQGVPNLEAYNLTDSLQ